MEEEESSISREELLSLYKNISRTLEIIRRNGTSKDHVQDRVLDDSANAYLYILFVLMFYAFSIVVLMIKYIKREREGSKLEYYYSEFVKRDW